MPGNEALQKQAISGIIGFISIGIIQFFKKPLKLCLVCIGNFKTHQHPAEISPVHPVVEQ